MNKLSHRIPGPGLAQLISKPETEGAKEHHKKGAEAEAQSQEAGEKENIHVGNTSPRTRPVIAGEHRIKNNLRQAATKRTLGKHHRVNTFLPSSVKATLGLLLTGFLGGVLP